MIQPNSMMEALQRGLLGLGGIGTALEDKKKNDAAMAQAAASTREADARTAGLGTETAGKDIANKQADFTFKQALGTKQIQDLLDKNNQDLNSFSQKASPTPLGAGVAGPLQPGQNVGDQDFAKQKQLQQQHWNLLAQLERDKDPMATPQLMEAKYGSILKQAQNTGTLSDQSVIFGQRQNDTGAVDLETKKATQQADIADKNLAPTKTRAGIGLIGSEINKNNADANKAKNKIDLEHVPQIEQNLRQQFLNQNKPFADVRDAHTRIQASSNDAAGDLALVYNYMKILDPGSTVREGEFANAQNAAGIPERILNSYNNALKGTRLGADQRSQFKGQADKLFEAQKGLYNNSVKSFGDIAKNYGANPSNVTVDLAGPEQVAPQFDHLSDSALDAELRSRGIDPMTGKQSKGGVSGSF